MNSTAGREIGRENVYLPGLDGLRAISVLVVVAFHSGVIDGGWIGESAIAAEESASEENPESVGQSGKSALTNN